MTVAVHHHVRTLFVIRLHQKAGIKLRLAFRDGLRAVLVRKIAPGVSLHVGADLVLAGQGALSSGRRCGRLRLGGRLLCGRGAGKIREIRLVGSGRFLHRRTGQVPEMFSIRDRLLMLGSFPSGIHCRLSGNAEKAVVRVLLRLRSGRGSSRDIPLILKQNIIQRQIYIQFRQVMILLISVHKISYLYLYL